MSNRLFETIRRTVMLAIGAAGLLYQTFSPGAIRIELVVTDFILIGLVPVDIFLTRTFPKPPVE